MTQNTTPELLAELRELDRTDTSPFPYQGCRKLIRHAPEASDGLIPNLNTYFMDIVGYASWGKGILKWPEQKVQQTIARLSVTFFEKHPEYSTLESMITKSSTPDLYANLALYERMRLCLLQILYQVQDHEG